MRRFSTILLYVTIAFLLLWQLPWCYNFFIVKPEKTPIFLHAVGSHVDKFDPFGGDTEYVIRHFQVYTS